MEYKKWKRIIIKIVGHNISYLLSEYHLYIFLFILLVTNRDGDYEIEVPYEDISIM